MSGPAPFVREGVLLRERVEEWERHPFSNPAVHRLESLAPHQTATVSRTQMETVQTPGDRC